jgi:hypothetical protein
MRRKTGDLALSGKRFAEIDAAGSLFRHRVLKTMVGAVPVHGVESDGALKASLIGSVEVFRETRFPCQVREKSCGLGELLGGFRILTKQPVADLASHGLPSPFLSQHRFDAAAAVARFFELFSMTPALTAKYCYSVQAVIFSSWGLELRSQTNAGSYSRASDAVVSRNASRRRGLARVKFPHSELPVGQTPWDQRRTCSGSPKPRSADPSVPFVETLTIWKSKGAVSVAPGLPRHLLAA